MKVLLQRVRQASVDIAGQRVASTGAGLLVYVGVDPGDGRAEVEWLARKTAGLRIFPDEDGLKNMHRNVIDVSGEVLVVSQFTLAADTSRGMRPGFTHAAAPEQAESLYEAFVARLNQRIPVKTGQFGADMQVSSINDGPVTILLER